MKPSVGRIVHYRISVSDADAVNRRRTTAKNIAERINDERWPLGAQAHIGNTAHEGDVLPMLIVRVWPDEYGPGHDGVNGQVFLDGCDALWVTSIKEGDGLGQWSWPPKVA